MAATTLGVGAALTEVHRGPCELVSTSGSILPIRIAVRTEAIKTLQRNFFLRESRPCLRRNVAWREGSGLLAALEAPAGRKPAGGRARRRLTHGPKGIMKNEEWSSMANSKSRHYSSIFTPGILSRRTYQIRHLTRTSVTLMALRTATHTAVMSRQTADE